MIFFAGNSSNNVLCGNLFDFFPMCFFKCFLKWRSFPQETVPAMSYVAIVAVITFVVGFATGFFPPGFNLSWYYQSFYNDLITGPGSIPWFFVTELFAQSGTYSSFTLRSFLDPWSFSPYSWSLIFSWYILIIYIVIKNGYFLYRECSRLMILNLNKCLRPILELNKLK